MKNRLLHLLGKVLLLSLLATACHKETAQPDPAPDKLNYELYENVCTDLSTYVKTYEEKEYDALIRYAEAIPGVELDTSHRQHPLCLHSRRLRVVL